MDADLTRHRMERKFLVPPALVPELVSRIPVVDRSAYRVTSVYFDRPDGALARRALATPHECTQLRARVYADGPEVWMEVKRRSRTWTHKLRFVVEQPVLSAMLRGEPLEGPRLYGGPCDECRTDILEAYRQFRAAAGGTLAPVGLVSVWRQAFRVPDPLVRLTLDGGIRYFRAPKTGHAGPAVPPDQDALMEQPGAVLEVKHAASLPAWFDDIVRGLRPTAYSKFRTLLGCLDGRSAGERHVG